MKSDSVASALSRSPGRPREFDVDAAVDGAVLVFRERGYHATSVIDLSAATGLTAGSLYKAFGDKRGIFLAAFERYTNRRNSELLHLLKSRPNGREKISTMLHYYAESSYGNEGRRGCLVVSSAAALATFDVEIAAQVEDAMRRTEDLLHRLLVEGQKDGSIPVDIHAPAMARTIQALLQGLRVIGKAGRTRRDVVAAVEEALRLLR